MKVRFGHRDMVFPSEALGEIRPSIDLIDDPAALKQRIAEDGYLYLPGLIDRSGGGGTGPRDDSAFHG